MNIIAIETGTKLGYENYHGKFILEGLEICTWGYDKRQNKYISIHRHESYPKGWKKYYADSVQGLKHQLQKTFQP